MIYLAVLQVILAIAILLYLHNIRSVAIKSVNDIPRIEVRVSPYYRQESKKGLTKKARVVIGYQYQLFYGGAPVFQPHIVIEKEIQESDINNEIIDKYKNEAIEFVNALCIEKTGLGFILRKAKMIVDK
jgi:hypothetical protein